MMTDISGIDRDLLLFRLWQATCQHNNGRWPVEFDLDQAKGQANVAGYVDYACGRPIKATILDESVTMVDTSLYDRDAGVGTFQRVVDTIRAEEL